jgi:MtN3 and saliva related transmembrane protein
MAQAILSVVASSWAVLMGIAPALQIRRMLRQRSSRDVSVGYFTILLVGFVLWIAYGAAAGIIALVIPNTVALLTGAAVVIIALLLRRRPSRRTSAPADGGAQH